MSGTLVLSGLSSTRFIWTNFATSGGNFLIACNGVDPVQNDNGTSWSAPSITGVASATLAYVFPFKSRLFFLKKNTSDAWFLPVDSIARAAGSFQLGVNVLADFRVTSAAVSTASFNVAGGGPLWDVALWDAAAWSEGGDSAVNQAWMGIAGSGYYLAPVVLTSANSASPANVEFIAMNMLYETGAPLS